MRGIGRMPCSRLAKARAFWSTRETSLSGETSHRRSRPEAEKAYPRVGAPRARVRVVLRRARPDGADRNPLRRDRPRDGGLGRLAHATSQRNLSFPQASAFVLADRRRDRKSTRLNSSHVEISYAVFCLKKKIKAPIHNSAPFYNS